jgi:hypothetical protein
VTCHFVRLLVFAAGCGYRVLRGVPGHPSKHGANMNTRRSRPLRKQSPLSLEEELAVVQSAGLDLASVTDTIRNLRPCPTRKPGFVL